MPAAIQPAWPEVLTSTEQKLTSCAFLGRLLCADKDSAVSLFRNKAQSFGANYTSHCRLDGINAQPIRPVAES